MQFGGYKKINLDMEKDMNNEHTLWVEKYRPTSLDTYLGNEHLKSKVFFILKVEIYHIYFYMEKQVQVKPLLQR